MPIKRTKDGVYSYINPKTGHVYNAGENGRIDFSKISGSFPLPDLVAIQTKSFEWFKEKGLDEAMKEVFPPPPVTETKPRPPEMRILSISSISPMP